MVPTGQQESTLSEAIGRGSPVELQGHTLTESYQNRLEMAVRLVLGQYAKDELVPIVNSVVQELVLWASLANMRQVYFEEHGMDPRDPVMAAAHEDDFQRSLNMESMRSYREGARHRGLVLRTRLTHNEAGLRIEVMNNALHSEHHEQRLRRLLREAMSYEDVMEYFKDNPEDTDGRHLGLALSLLMLREENLRPELMRIGRSEDATTNSRLEIPFDTGFRSIREMLLNDELPHLFDGAAPIPLGLAVEDPGLVVVCPVCGQTVSEKVFFQDLPVGMLDDVMVRNLRPAWLPVHGACASCIAVYGLDT